MKYSLLIKQEALEDLQDAFDYYEEQRKGLGKLFLDSVQECMNRLEKNPLHFQIKKKTFREAVVKIFPYLIIFEVIEKEIVVYAIFNSWKNPKKKPK